MIKINTSINQDKYRFVCKVSMLYIDKYEKTTDYSFDYTFMNLSGKYNLDLSAICIAVMALSTIDPGYRDEVEMITPSQLVVDIINKKVTPEGIYKNYGDKLIMLLDTFPRYKIIKR